MSRKKTRQVNISQEALDRARREASGELYAPPIEAIEGSARKNKVEAITSKKTTPEMLGQEYLYVLNDLRSMAVLAVVLFAGLIVLSFVL